MVRICEVPIRNLVCIAVAALGPAVALHLDGHPYIAPGDSLVIDEDILLLPSRFYCLEILHCHHESTRFQ